MAYGVYMAAKKLKHYFQEHPIRVVAEAPISEIISNKDASGRIAKWAIELSPYTPRYDKRDTIKSLWPISSLIGPRYNTSHHCQMQIICNGPVKSPF
jgi:hypothetical protein